MAILLAFLSVLALPGQEADPAPARTAPPARTAAEGPDTGVLLFAVHDDRGTAIPARLTFIGPEGPGAELFPNHAADPEDLAVRSNVIYTLSGEGRVTVPAGVYTVYASRGLEWSIDSRSVTIAAGAEATWTARLAHEVDTRGWVSGDFHLHTLTWSGHGDSNPEERVISLVGEGVEFAVATDHNHNADYRPTMERLGAGGRMTAITGNEVSTPIGHFNAFPLDPARPPVAHRLRDATTLFSIMRAEPNEFGVDPIVQVNHPRWTDIDYFGRTGLDPVSGTPRTEAYSDDFDAIEVLNENASWGYHDADVAGDLPVGSSVHWALGDWFNLLNRGHRSAAVGNSDSHSVYTMHAGFPRNFVRCDDDDAGAIDPAAVVEAVRRGEVFTTVGPFVEIDVGGSPMGSFVRAAAGPDGGGTVDLHVRVQAASWIDCDRVKIVVNGDVVEVIEVSETRQVTRLDTVVPVAVRGDSWVLVLVEGDDALAPIVHDASRPIRPIAVTNPIRVDADGRAGWTPPAEAAGAAIAAAAGDRHALERLYANARPRKRAMLVLAGAGDETAGTLLARRGLGDPDRFVRLAGTRAAERLGAASLRPDLEAVLGDEATDAYLAVSALRALRSAGAATIETQLVAFLDRYGPAAIRRYADDLADMLPGRPVLEWMTIGYFEGRRDDALLRVAYGPEADDDLSADLSATHPDRQGVPVGWTEATARPDGFLSLLHLDPRPELYENAIAYARTWLHVSQDQDVLYAIGTDDGCRLFVNGQVIHEDPALHGASPLQHVARMNLRAGWNSVLVKVENGTGNFGLYFRVFDEHVESRRRGPSGASRHGGG